MGSTKISAQQTAGELVGELVKAGASSVNTDYKGGKISGLRWIMRVGGVDALFEIPIRVEPILKKLGGQDTAQAERVAWRQLLRWVQAQNAMIEVGMAQPGEVYLAYAVDPRTNRTIFDQLLTTQFKALPPGKAN